MHQVRFTNGKHMFYMKVDVTIRLNIEHHPKKVATDQIKKANTTFFTQSFGCV